MSGHGQLKLKQKMAPRVGREKAKIGKRKEKKKKRRGKRGGKDNMKQQHHGQQPYDASLFFHPDSHISKAIDLIRLDFFHPGSLFQSRVTNGLRSDPASTSHRLARKQPQPLRNRTGPGDPRRNQTKKPVDALDGLRQISCTHYNRVAASGRMALDWLDWLDPLPLHLAPSVLLVACWPPSPLDQTPESGQWGSAETTASSTASFAFHTHFARSRQR